MPHVAISMIPGRDQNEKRDLAIRVQNFICEELNLEKSVVSVSIEEIPLERWDAHMEQIPPETILTKGAIHDKFYRA
ncbi:Tautomerase enzyme [Clostridium sp. MCC353]|uniref:tautomerase family protein n=1 Tax=Clostridium sp. MCC353 TaxID=2592646 RepID=UPI001C00C65C|nr:tautomerase family protein [Clostridium sp. MCC353]MBT9779664.1 Tautomerase enzyme [Clostridium sp. MCC353]